jgi:hypothetical protein
MRQSLKRVGLGVFVLVVLLVACSVWFYVSYYRNSLQHRYHRIQRGMSQNEVEDLLGCPPGDYRNTAINHSAVAVPKVEFQSSLTWIFDEGAVYLFIGDQGNVVAKRYSWAVPTNRLEALTQQFLLYPIDEQ